MIKFTLNKMFAKFFSSQKDESGKRYGGYFFSSKKDGDIIGEEDEVDDNNNNNDENNINNDNDNEYDDNSTETNIKEKNYTLRINKLETKGIYRIDYVGDDETQIVLRNITVQKFHDGTMKKIIDVDHIYKPTLLSNSLFSQKSNNNDFNEDDHDNDDGNDSMKSVTEVLKNIVEKGDILVMINKTMVYDKHLDEVTNMMLKLSETGETKKLLFLKPSKVSLDNFLKDYYHLQNIPTAAKGELLNLSLSNLYGDNLEDVGTMFDQQDPAIIIKIGDIYTFTTGRVQDGGTHCAFHDRFNNIQVSSIDLNRGLTMDFEVHNFDRLNQSKGLIGKGSVRIIDVIKERMFKTDFKVPLISQGELHMSAILSKVIENDGTDTSSIDESSITDAMFNNNLRSSKSWQQYALKKYKNMQVDDDDFADIAEEDQQVIKEQVIILYFNTF